MPLTESGGSDAHLNCADGAGEMEASIVLSEELLSYSDQAEKTLSRAKVIPRLTSKHTLSLPVS
jgi:hypothetical protein